ncbi:MAG: hypothetical protein AAF432_10360 [Planctomycetota bacterium]
MRNTIALVAAIAAAFGLSTSPADAGLVEYAFSGQVTDFEGAGAGMWSGVTVDDRWTVSAIIDMDAEDENSNPNISRRRLESLSLTIGSLTDTGWTDRTIWIFSTSSLHQFSVSGEYNDGNTGAIWRLSLGLRDSTESIFDDDTLPMDLSLDDFDDTSFSLERITALFNGDVGDPFELNGTIDSVTVNPVPGPGGLAIGCWLLAFGQRRKRE